MMTLETYLKNRRARIEKNLKKALEGGPRSELSKAMRYSVLGVGKRLRPLLVYAAGEALGASLSALDIPAAAVELMHQFSLIHDDLPAMDNDDYRRGRLTCHKKFGEPLGILTGDALQTLSFDLLSKPTRVLKSAMQIKMIQILAKAIGVLGICYGQTLDIDETSQLSESLLEKICQKKCGIFFVACLQMGAVAAGKDTKKILEGLTKYGYDIGLAFQLQDDIFDIKKDSQKSEQPKNFAILAGEEKTRKKAIKLYRRALDQLEKMGLGQSMLVPITQLMLRRLH